MNFEELTSTLPNAITLKQTSPTSWQIVSGATYLNGSPVKSVFNSGQWAMALNWRKRNIKIYERVVWIKIQRC